LIYRGSLLFWGLAFQWGVVQLNWTDESSDESGFQIERKVVGGSWSSLATVGPNVSSYLDFSSVVGVTYQYRGRAFNDLNSDWSNTAAGIITTVPPLAPSDLVATAETSTGTYSVVQTI
jgi:hypothetical protein